MAIYYKPDSIRIASYQRKSPDDIGRFRPHTRPHELRAFVGELDGQWHASLPFGSTLGSFDSEAEALDAGAEWLAQQGWTRNKADADAASIAHAGARVNNHPGRGVK